MGEDGAVIIRADLDDKKAQAELNRLARKIDNINDQIEGKTRKRSYLEERAAKIQEAYKDAISTDGADEYAQRLAKEYTQVQTAKRQHMRGTANRISTLHITAQSRLIA